MASAGPLSMDSMFSAYSLPSMPTMWTPRARTPAAGPGPTTLTKMMAYTSSGNALSRSVTNFAAPATAGVCRHRVVALMKDQGNAMTVAMTMLRKAMQMVWSMRLTRSSPLPS